jgi:hypothetical protein
MKLNRQKVSQTIRLRNISKRHGLKTFLDKLTSAFYKPVSVRTIAQVAQLVEHATENRSVGGSIPPLGTNDFNKLTVRRFFQLDNLCG